MLHVDLNNYDHVNLIMLHVYIKIYFIACMPTYWTDIEGIQSFDVEYGIYVLFITNFLLCLNILDGACIIPNVITQ